MGLSLRRRKDEQRSDSFLSIDDYIGILNEFSYMGTSYGFLGSGQTTYPGARQEVIGPSFLPLARLAYKGDSVVFACMAVRAMLLSEGRFAFRQLRNGRPGNLFGTADLAILEQPWPGGTTGDLIARAIQHADLAGNAFLARVDDTIVPLRPDWTSIIIGSPTDKNVTAWDVNAKVLGYAYQEGGPGGGADPHYFLAEEVAHFAPTPDPEARFRGMSWLTPLIREVMADKAMTEHKLKFMENAATPNLLVKLDVPDLDTFERWVEKFRLKHEGSRNAYKTMFMAAGADATVIGADLKQIDFKVTQGAGETRIAAAAGVPPVVVGLSEGLAAATYSNYGQAMRRLADLTARPLWRNLCGSLANIITVPGGAELWIDDRDIAALRGDQTDAAEIQQKQASSMQILINAGFEPDTVIDAVTSGDMARLQHTGLVSVQLQPPGSELPADPGEPGTTNPPVALAPAPPALAAGSNT